MKKIILLMILFVFFGCGVVERFEAKVTGHSKMCVDGVEYIQFTSGASVAYTTDGKIKLCK